MTRRDLGGPGPRIPIIQIRDYLTVSVHDQVDDVQARQLLDDVGAAVRRSNARALVIDVSAVDIMDSFLAGSIRDAAAVARWMGVRTVISGLSPAVAITLLDMGVEIRDVTTTRDLDQALDQLDTEVGRDRQLEARMATLLARPRTRKRGPRDAVAAPPTVPAPGAVQQAPHKPREGTTHSNSAAGASAPADAGRRTPWLLGPRAATRIASSSR